ncbi:MAG: HEAT repeat domain-containing protein [Acidobacteriia bacterium]|nr:HEAT repeat domain-containing protein [Terriglobia bacterium]
MLVIIALTAGQLACLDFGVPLEPRSFEGRLTAILSDWDQRRDDLWEIPVSDSKPILRRWLREAGDDASRLIRLMSALGWLAASEEPDLIRKRLSHPDEAVRLAAIRALGQTQDPDNAPGVEPFLDSKDARFRAAAIAALAKLWPRSNYPRLQAAAGSDPNLQRLAEQARRHMMAMATLNPAQIANEAIETGEYEDLVPWISEVREPLKEMLKSGERSAVVRGRAARILGLRHQEEVSWTLRTILGNADEPMELRVEAAYALGRIRIRSSVDALIELLDSVDPRMQEAAVFALGKIGEPRALRPLLAKWNVRGGALRNQIRLAAGRLCSSDGQELLTGLLRADADLTSEGIWFLEDRLELHESYQERFIEPLAASPSPQARRDALLLRVFFGHKAEAAKAIALARADEERTNREIAELALHWLESRRN